jgi:peptide/nickel transport system substrate-binding protein
MIIFSMSIINLAVYGSNEPTVSVEPKNSVFSTAEKTVGDTIQINCTVANVTGLVGFQFRLSWNPTLLVCTGMQEILFHTVTPTAFWWNIWNCTFKYNNTAGTADYFQSWMDLPRAAADGYAPANITVNEYPEGKLAAAIITLMIVSEPLPGGFKECSLDLSNTIMGDVNGVRIAHTVSNGYYKLTSSAHAGDVPNPDHLVLGVSNLGGARFDPATIGSIPSYRLVFNIYEPLISLDRDKMDSFVPKLATSWQISADGLTYQFTIRQGVKFHNGDLLTTEDVEYSFERILVTDYNGWVSWVFYDSLFGLPSSRDENGSIIILGSQIDDAITRDSTTVTFHLPRPYPPFMQALAAWGFVVNKEWCVALNEWPGTWNNWTDYNRPYSMINEQNLEPPGPHINGMCGTGPFKLDYKQVGVECSIIKFNDYWGKWPAPGANGTLQRVTYRLMSDWATRRDQFLAGELDTIEVPLNSTGEVLGQDGVRCIYPLSVLDCHAMLFNFNISSESPYAGVPGGLPSGTFNESGIPLDFFTDINIRKGFAYAFNYSQFIDEVFGGDVYQPATPFLPELPFYDPTVQKYSTNLTAAAEHIGSAWNGSLWTNGFNFTVCCLDGDLTTQRFYEILETNIESLNPKFHVNISFSNYSDWSERDERMFTLFLGGFIADFADPHDMAVGFVKSTGPYPFLQSYKNATVDSLVDQGIATTNSSERQQIYHELQVLYHEDCPSVPLYQSRGRRFERDWVHGWYYNPVLGVDYFYGEWKEQPHTSPIIPGENVINGTATADTVVLINTTAPGNLSMSTYDIASVGTTPEGYEVHSIKCVAIDTTVPHEDITFPIEIRVYYTDQELVSAYIDQATLRMFTWNGTAWISENETGVVTPSDVAGYSGYVWARIWHLSEFAAMGQKALIHAVAPLGVRSTKTSIGQGSMTTVYVDAFNQGDYEETFDVTVYANEALICSFANLTLPPRSSATISMIGNTSTLVIGTYRLVVTLDAVPGESATTDNTFLGGQISVSIPGDVNGNFIVDIFDAIMLAGAYDSNPGKPNWNPNADINSDSTVDIFDAILLANHYGQHYP